MTTSKPICLSVSNWDRLRSDTPSPSRMPTLMGFQNRRLSSFVLRIPSIWVRRGIPTHFVFVLLGPPEAAAGHLDTLMTIARLMADDEFRYEARPRARPSGTARLPGPFCRENCHSGEAYQQNALMASSFRVGFAVDLLAMSDADGNHMRAISAMGSEVEPSVPRCSSSRL